MLVVTLVAGVLSLRAARPAADCDGRGSSAALRKSRLKAVRPPKHRFRHSVLVLEPVLLIRDQPSAEGSTSKLSTHGGSDASEAAKCSRASGRTAVATRTPFSVL